MLLSKTSNGVPYDEWLTGPDGMHFTLHPEKGLHTDEDVIKARNELRRNRDVVSMHVIWKDKEWFREIRYMSNQF